jgi:hypothetical protein
MYDKQNLINQNSTLYIYKNTNIISNENTDCIYKKDLNSKSRPRICTLIWISYLCANIYVITLLFKGHMEFWLAWCNTLNATPRIKATLLVGDQSYTNSSTSILSKHKLQESHLYHVDQISHKPTRICH